MSKTSQDQSTHLNNITTQLKVAKSFRHLFTMQKLESKSRSVSESHRQCTDSYTVSTFTHIIIAILQCEHLWHISKIYRVLGFYLTAVVGLTVKLKRFFLIHWTLTYEGLDVPSCKAEHKNSLAGYLTNATSDACRLWIIEVWTQGVNLLPSPWNNIYKQNHCDRQSNLMHIFNAHHTKLYVPVQKIILSNVAAHSKLSKCTNLSAVWTNCSYSCEQFGFLLYPVRNLH